MIKDDWPVFADQDVRFRGQTVALLVGPDRAVLASLAARTSVDYAEVKPALTVDDALALVGGPLHGTNNLYAEHTLVKGRPRRGVRPGGHGRGGAVHHGRPGARVPGAAGLRGRARGRWHHGLLLDPVPVLRAQGRGPHPRLAARARARRGPRGRGRIRRQGALPRRARHRRRGRGAEDGAARAPRARPGRGPARHLQAPPLADHGSAPRSTRRAGSSAWRSTSCSTPGPTRRAARSCSSARSSPRPASTTSRTSGCAAGPWPPTWCPRTRSAASARRRRSSPSRCTWTTSPAGPGSSRWTSGAGTSPVRAAPRSPTVGSTRKCRCARMLDMVDRRFGLPGEVGLPRHRQGHRHLVRRRTGARSPAAASAT